MSDFAEGLRAFYTVGELYKRTYLTKAAREVLNEVIKETLEITCDMDDDRFNQTMDAMRFIQHKLGDKTVIPVNLTVEIASYIYYWSSKMFKYTEESEPHQRALQWLHNLWCRKWSISDMTLIK